MKILFSTESPPSTIMTALNRSAKFLLLLLGSSLIVVAILFWVFCLGNQQVLQESMIALNAHPPQAGFLAKMGFASVWDAPLFSQLLALLKVAPWLVQGLWVAGLGFGFFAFEAIGQVFLSHSTQRRLFLGLLFFTSLWGYWQYAAINFQTYTLLGIGLLGWFAIRWFKAKAAPVKGDTLPLGQPNWQDICLGCTLGVMTYEWGMGLSLLLLGGLLFRHQQVSTVLPATWQMRSFSLLRWLWIGLLAGLLVEAACLYFFGHELPTLPPLFRIPPILPEWMGWQAGVVNGIGLRTVSLLGAFFPWGSFLLMALWDLWLNVQKGGSKASLFLEVDRQSLRWLHLAGFVSGLLWLVFPSFWLGWGFFLVSHAYLLADWLASACTLSVDSNRFKQGFLWTSFLLLALGLAGLIWENHATSFQLSSSPFVLQWVQTISSLWCVLGGCLGLLVLWKSTFNLKYYSVGLASWFTVWMLIHTLGATPLLAWQGGSQADIVAPAMLGKKPETVGVCLNKKAQQQGTFYAFAGRGSLPLLQKQAMLSPLSVAACLDLDREGKPTLLFKFVLMNETLYYENKQAHPHWQSPLMGLYLSHLTPAFTPVIPSVLHPLLLPFMVPQQETWVLVPLVARVQVKPTVLVQQQKVPL